MLRWILILWLVAGCNPAPGPAPGDSFAWVQLEALQDDLDAAVASHAGKAAALSLEPIVHISPSWNSGVYLEKFRGDPVVHRALRGFYLIEIGYGSTCLQEDCRNTWAQDVLCGTYAQTIHAVSPKGLPTKPSGTPGKFGPWDAPTIAAMFSDYRALLTRSDADDCALLRSL